MRKNDSSTEDPELEMDQAQVLQQSLPDAVLRTRSLFAAERLLTDLAENGATSRWRKEAQTVIEHYPTKLDLMRIAGEHPMLDAGEAQRLCGRLHPD